METAGDRRNGQQRETAGKGISEADRRKVLERMREIKGVRIAFG
jgi:hypothetical protein